MNDKVVSRIHVSRTSFRLNFHLHKDTDDGKGVNQTVAGTCIVSNVSEFSFEHFMHYEKFSWG